MATHQTAPASSHKAVSETENLIHSKHISKQKSDKMGFTEDLGFRKLIWPFKKSSKVRMLMSKRFLQGPKCQRDIGLSVRKLKLSSYKSS